MILDSNRSGVDFLDSKHVRGSWRGEEIEEVVSTRRKERKGKRRNGVGQSSPPRSVGFSREGRKRRVLPYFAPNGRFIEEERRETERGIERENLTRDA